MATNPELNVKLINYPRMCMGWSRFVNVKSFFFFIFAEGAILDQTWTWFTQSRRWAENVLIVLVINEDKVVKSFPKPQAGWIGQWEVSFNKKLLLFQISSQRLCRSIKYIERFCVFRMNLIADVFESLCCKVENFQYNQKWRVLRWTHNTMWCSRDALNISNALNCKTCLISLKKELKLFNYD